LLDDTFRGLAVDELALPHPQLQGRALRIHHHLGRPRLLVAAVVGRRRLRHLPQGVRLIDVDQALRSVYRDRATRRRGALADGLARDLAVPSVVGLRNQRHGPPRVACSTSAVNASTVHEPSEWEEIAGRRLAAWAAAGRTRAAAAAPPPPPASARAVCHGPEARPPAGAL